MVYYYFAFTVTQWGTCRAGNTEAGGSSPFTITQMGTCSADNTEVGRKSLPNSGLGFIAVSRLCESDQPKSGLSLSISKFY